MKIITYFLLASTLILQPVLAEKIDTLNNKTVIEDSSRHVENKSKQSQKFKGAKKNILKPSDGIVISESQSPSYKDSFIIGNNKIKLLIEENKQFKSQIDELTKENEKLANLNTESENNGNRKSFIDYLFYYILQTLKVLLFLSFILVALIFLHRKKYININIPFPTANKNQPVSVIRNHSQFQKPSQANSNSTTQTIQTQKNNTPSILPPIIVTSQAQSTEPKSFSNIYGNNFKSNSKTKDWYVVGASSIGKSHIANNKPCQDNHYCENWGNGWGFAISCDGAGSAANSHLGSEFIATKVATKIFKEWIANNGFIKKSNLPEDEIWSKAGMAIYQQIFAELDKYSKTNQIELSSLASTIIAIVYSPIGLLISHIGDGRAGFCNEEGDWKSIITPHKGEEANQTLFITSTAWLNDANLKVSNVSVPECRVIREKPTAFTLMSDGCEAHSFDCSKMDLETNVWHDPNIPSQKFFLPLTEQLKSMHNHKVPFQEALGEWKKFLEEGTKGLKDEPDDKTLILGILI